MMASGHQIGLAGMLAVLCLASAALSGCVAEDDARAGADAGSADLAGDLARGDGDGAPGAGDSVFSQRYDFVPKVQDGKVVLLALHAKTNTSVSYNELQRITYDTDGPDAAAFVTWLHAPVGALKARAAGDNSATWDPEHGFGAVVGGCSGPVPLVVRVQGQSIADEGLPCSSRDEGHGDGKASLEAGEWMLFGAASCGFGSADLGDGDTWTVDIVATAPLEAEWLEPGPFSCGIDFEAYYETNVLGQSQGKAAFSQDSPYGGILYVAKGSSVEGDWVTPAGRQAMHAGDVVQLADGGAYGFEVARSDGLVPWFMLGI